MAAVARRRMNCTFVGVKSMHAASGNTALYRVYTVTELSQVQCWRRGSCTLGLAEQDFPWVGIEIETGSLEADEVILAIIRVGRKFDFVH